MSYSAAFALLALLPIAVNAAAPPHFGEVLTICSGDALLRKIVLPLSGPLPDDEKGCGNKGCHGVNSRKRSGCHI